MYIISPLSRCASSEKSERFLDHISNITRVTHASEPQTLAFAWFRGADDNTVPAHYVRGFEVYETVEANQVTHRASEEYKAFRRAVGSESLLEKPSDLRFWRPTGIGFLTRGEAVLFQSLDENQRVIVDELMPKKGFKEDVLAKLREVASLVSDEQSVYTFWVLDRGDDSEDDGIYILSRWASKSARSDCLSSRMGTLLEDAERVCNSWVQTSWRDSGIGFLKR